MRILLSIYRTEVKGNQSLEPPETVVRASKSFLDSCNPVALWLSANCILTGVHEDKHTVTAIHKYHKETMANRLVPMIGYKGFCAQIALCGLPSTSPNNRKMYHGLLLQVPLSVEQAPSSSQAPTSLFLPD
jgi:hypothetical protein